MSSPNRKRTKFLDFLYNFFLLDLNACVCMIFSSVVDHRRSMSLQGCGIRGSRDWAGADLPWPGLVDPSSVGPWSMWLAMTGLTELSSCSSDACHWCVTITHCFLGSFVQRWAARFCRRPECLKQVMGTRSTGIELMGADQPWLG